MINFRHLISYDRRPLLRPQGILDFNHFAGMDDFARSFFLLRPYSS